MLRAFYSDRFVLPLPDGHRFPMSKYARLRQRITTEGLLGADDLALPEAIDETAILRVHTPDYWRSVRDGTLDRRQQRSMGFPWSIEMVERSRRSVGATLAAARWALSRSSSSQRLRCGVNLAGGTHHAFGDRGEGFCVLNDVAVALRVLQAEGLVERGLVIDCDVHQGNGTAKIFENDSSCFTVSAHGQKNYPFHKERSDLDVGLADGCGDGDYAVALQRTLAEVEARWFNVDGGDAVVFYLAGADPFVGDRLGRLALSKDGLLRRDEVVLAWCQERELPVVVVMAGGYAVEPENTVDIHFRTVGAAVRRAG